MFSLGQIYLRSIPSAIRNRSISSRPIGSIWLACCTTNQYYGQSPSSLPFLPTIHQLAYLRTASVPSSSKSSIEFSSSSNSSSPFAKNNQLRLFADEKSPLKKKAEEFHEKRKETGFNAIDKEEDDQKNLTLTQRFKKMWKQYWYVLLPVHGFVCCAYFGLFYAISASGLDVISFLEWFHLPEYIMDKIRNAPAAGYVVVALALYKIATPLRYMTTLGVTYYAVKSLSRLGYIKPMPSRKRIKEIIDVKRDEFRDKRQHWRQERRFLLFKKRPQQPGGGGGGPPSASNGNGGTHHQHSQHQPKRKSHD